MISAQPLSIVIPAFNEETCIGQTVCDIQKHFEGIAYEIIVVDDGSTDNTAEVARNAGATVFSRVSNRGYGAALKTGIRQAQHPWVLLMDSDGQHNAADAKLLYEQMRQGHDMVIGARDKKSFQYASRMPGKKFLQWVAAYLVGEKPDDVNSGLRVFRRNDALKYLSILPNGFSFTTTITLAMLKDGCDVAWVPIQVKARQGRASTVRIKDGLGTLMLILRIAMLFNPLKVYLPMSVLLFVLGFIYAIYDIVRAFNIPDGAMLLMVAAIIVFFFGILADQLASIRRSNTQ